MLIKKIINAYGSMTQQEVTNSFIYHKWYEEDVLGYNLSNRYGNMLMYGYGDLFNHDNGKGFIPPYQRISFYCIDEHGYLKIFRLNTEYIPNWSIKDMLNDIESICIKYKLKFVSLFSTKYNYLWVVDFLGNDLRYEYNDKCETKLYI